MFRLEIILLHHFTVLKPGKFFSDFSDDTEKM